MDIVAFKNKFTAELNRLHSHNNPKNRKYSDGFKQGIIHLLKQGHEPKQLRQALGFDGHAFDHFVLAKKKEDVKTFKPLAIQETQSNETLSSKTMSFEFVSGLKIVVQF